MGCVERARVAELMWALEADDQAGLGLRDYVEMNRFPGVALGLSAGIDSAFAPPPRLTPWARGACMRYDPVEVDQQGELDEAAAAPATSASGWTRSRSRPPSRRRGDPAAALRGPRARSHRGEHPVAI